MSVTDLAAAPADRPAHRRDGTVQRLCGFAALVVAVLFMLWPVRAPAMNTIATEGAGLTVAQVGSEERICEAPLPYMSDPAPSVAVGQSLGAVIRDQNNARACGAAKLQRLRRALLVGIGSVFLFAAARRRETEQHLTAA